MKARLVRRRFAGDTPTKIGNGVAARNVLKPAFEKRIARHVPVRLKVSDRLVDPLILTIAQRGEIVGRQSDGFAHPLANLLRPESSRIRFDEHTENGQNDINFSCHGSKSFMWVSSGGGAEQTAPPPFAADQELSVSRPSGSLATPLNGPSEDFLSMN